MITVAVLLLTAAVAVALAAVLRRRDADAPDQGSSWAVPTHLDRRDFDRPDAEWLVVVFSSSTCLACQGTVEKAQVLESEAVAVQDVEAVTDKDLHDRYGVDAVPMVLVADSGGSVRRSFLGPPTATDLWAAVAELREPGSVPEGCTTSDSPCSTDPS